MLLMHDDSETNFYTCQKMYSMNVAKDDFDDDIDQLVIDNDMENEQCECP